MSTYCTYVTINYSRWTQQPVARGSFIITKIAQSHQDHVLRISRQKEKVLVGDILVECVLMGANLDFYYVQPWRIYCQPAGGLRVMLTFALSLLPDRKSPTQMACGTVIHLSVMHFLPFIPYSWYRGRRKSSQVATGFYPRLLQQAIVLKPSSKNIQKRRFLLKILGKILKQKNNRMFSKIKLDFIPNSTRTTSFTYTEPTFNIC